MDMNDPGYPGRVVLYAFFGIFDAMWQTTVYWLLGAMSNDPAKLAHFSGFCMFVAFITLRLTDYLYSQINPCSLQAAQVFGVQTQWVLRESNNRQVMSVYTIDLRYINIFVSVWSLLACGLVFAFPMIYIRVKEHTKLEDETLYVH
jgi:hypothetical protein